MTIRHLHTGPLTACALFWLAASVAPAAARQRQQTSHWRALHAQLETRLGVQIVFADKQLPRRTSFYDIMLAMSAGERVRALTALSREASLYPPGYLRAIGLRTIGLFRGLASRSTDGHRKWDYSLGGYRYFGKWNGKDAIAIAFYSPTQFSRTLHHEVYHQVDATWRGTTRGQYYDIDDPRYAEAVQGYRLYAGIRLPHWRIRQLRAAGSGKVLHGAVSNYSFKHWGEDQADTARYTLGNLADALVQVATRPELPGSQRIIHVLHAYQIAVPKGPTREWFVQLALFRGGNQHLATTRFPRPRSLATTLYGRIVRNRRFVVNGRAGSDGINWTLRSDLWRITRGAIERSSHGHAHYVRHNQTSDTLRTLTLLARYYNFINGRWGMTPTTAQYFDHTRRALLAALPHAQRRQLVRMTFAQLARYRIPRRPNSGAAY